MSPLEAGTTHVPPHSKEAEQAVLGGVLLVNSALDQIDLEPEDFYEEKNKLIYRAMLVLHQRRQPIDELTLHDALTAGDKRADVGGASYLAELQDRTPSAANIAEHARIVKDNADLRRLITVAREIVQRGYSGEDVEGVLTVAADRLTVLSQSRHDLKTAKTILGTLHAFRWQAQAWQTTPPEREWLIPAWLPRGRVGLLAGTGGTGKSRLALQLAAAIAAGASDWLPGSHGDHKLSVHAPSHAVIASWEDEADEIGRRLHGIDQADAIGDRLHALGPTGSLWEPDPKGTRQTSTTGVLSQTGQALRRYCELVQARLLVIDPLAAAYGLNENDRALVRQFMADWDAWAQAARCTVMIVSHPPKNESKYSGSTDWHAASRWFWTLGLENTEPAVKEDKRPAPQLCCIKQSYGRTPDPYWLSGYPAWRAADKTDAATAWAGFVDDIQPREIVR